MLFIGGSRAAATIITKHSILDVAAALDPPLLLFFVIYGYMVLKLWKWCHGVDGVMSRRCYFYRDDIICEPTPFLNSFMTEALKMEVPIYRNQSIDLQSK